MVIFADGGRNNEGRYYCRGCGRHGDAVSWRVDIEGRKASDVLPKDRKVTARFTGQEKKRQDDFEPGQFHRFSKMVAEAAHRHCHDADAMRFYSSRGMTGKTLEACGFGWIPRDVFFSAVQTGRTDGKSTCVPAGACFPIMGDEGGIDALLVRRADETQWKKWGKWAQIGKRDIPFLLGTEGQSLVVCESVLDAASAWQSRGGNISCIAMLGASKKLTGKALEWVRTAKKILVCADADTGGVNLCKTILHARSDALIWRPVGEGVKDINDVLINYGDAETGLWLDMGFSELILDNEEF